MSDLLSTNDVSLRLGVSAVYVRKLADAGKLAAERTVGGQRIFRADDVESLRREREAQKKRQIKR
ncbi:MAG: helix-turn-helix domain-containing protein [Blastocatellia bacterium]|nr:helix-turn-helix domain-containing protein [Blastocatellia bacterium]